MIYSPNPIQASSMQKIWMMAKKRVNDLNHEFSVFDESVLWFRSESGLHVLVVDVHGDSMAAFTGYSGKISIQHFDMETIDDKEDEIISVFLNATIMDVPT